MGTAKNTRHSREVFISDRDWDNIKSKAKTSGHTVNEYLLMKAIGREYASNVSQQKSVGGRPWAKDGRKMRSFKVSDFEWKVIQDSAEYYGLDVSEFIRHRAMTDDSKYTPVDFEKIFDRPRKDLKKTQTFRASDEEWNTITERAAKTGMKVTSYVRYMAVGMLYM